MALLVLKKIDLSLSLSLAPSAASLPPQNILIELTHPEFLEKGRRLRRRGKRAWRGVGKIKRPPALQKDGNVEHASSVVEQSSSEAR